MPIRHSLFYTLSIAAFYAVDMRIIGRSIIETLIASTSKPQVAEDYLRQILWNIAFKNATCNIAVRHAIYDIIN